MAKKIKAQIKLQIAAGAANPAPPVGSILGPHGINLGEFCARFNDATKAQAGSIIPAEITIYEDRTYEFKLKTPPASDLLRKAAGITKGSGQPNKAKVGKVTKAQIKEIAEKKMSDLNVNSLEAAMRSIEGTAKNMGIEVKD
ncbi:MAG TPA: 50S ribosomal protein L11 [Candidatus Paceibacterota bacterium]|jgi:large subunit ribosomal protein L11|nr:50S ribosomal protein L11 [Candidatus Paceibacterota bacterium]HPT40290.1 50S ribosomal protein L11 [Candidatus Paceibacterota bacterium]